jgi:hypothetical protein
MKLEGLFVAQKTKVIKEVKEPMQGQQVVSFR